MTLVATVGFAAVSVAHSETRFLDHRNKEIVFEKPPEKIVSMFASGPIVYYAVEGKADHIAGVYEKGLKMYQTSIYGELIPEFLKLKSNVGGEGFVPNREVIELLQRHGYGGYVSFKWEKPTYPDLPDAEVALPCFIAYMRDVLAKT